MAILERRFGASEQSERTGLTNTGRFSGHMASSLVQGVGATAKTGIKGIATNMQNRMAQTIPGRVASAIRQRAITESCG
jgi:hypothetical protein